MSPDLAKRSVDLKRSLLLRVTLFAVVICLVASALVLEQARTRIRRHIERTGGTIERLIRSEAAQPRDVFRRSIEGLRLSMLDDLGALVNICVKVEDIYNHVVADRCFAEAQQDAPRVLRWLMGRLLGADVRYRGVIDQYPGIKVGEFVMTPNLDTEARVVWDEIRTVLVMTAGVLLLNFLVYLPVRRALRPTDEILSVLARMEEGDLAARMPRPRLIELARIAAGFDHLAARLRETLDGQRQLAQRLLSVREEERRYLARELHDEFGQCLASIRVECVCVSELARDGLPAVLPSTEAISRTATRMMEALQGILHQLRPVGLEEFGLVAALEQLVEGWRRGRPGCRYALSIEGEVDDLPDGLTVSLYRIVQESLTNAARHGDPAEVAVSLCRTPEGIVVTVEDDGHGGGRDRAGGGLGVLGMRERVLALGGTFTLGPRVPRGTQVRAAFPALATQRLVEQDGNQDHPVAGR